MFKQWFSIVVHHRSDDVPHDWSIIQESVSLLNPKFQPTLELEICEGLSFRYILSDGLRFVWFGNYFSLDMTVDIRRVLTIAAVMVTDGDKFFNSLVHCAVPNKDWLVNFLRFCCIFQQQLFALTFYRLLSYVYIGHMSDLYLPMFTTDLPCLFARLTWCDPGLWW